MNLDDIARHMWREILPHIPIPEVGMESESALAVLKRESGDIRLDPVFDGDRECWAIQSGCCRGMTFPRRSLAYLAAIQQVDNESYNIHQRLLYLIRFYEPVSTSFLIDILTREQEVPPRETARALRVIAERNLIQWDLTMRWIPVPREL
jgi:hypothetical protein